MLHLVSAVFFLSHEGTLPSLSLHVFPPLSAVTSAFPNVYFFNG